jgi:ribonuclease VapC
MLCLNRERRSADVKRKRLLDTFAILAWLRNEPGAPQVEAALEHARQGRAELLVTLINLGELYYILRRQYSKVETRALIDEILSLPIRLIPVDESLVWEAAEIKAQHPLSYADAFSVAAAKLEGASVITGDPEFASVEESVEIEWLNR